MKFSKKNNNDAPTSMSEKYKVLFVCLGNICRSPAAQAVLLRLVDERGLASHFHIDSAGTYGGHAGWSSDPRMIKHAKRRGYSLTHLARQVKSDDLVDFDLIVGMDARNVSDLKAMAASPAEAAKVVSMGRYITQFPHYDHVPDPYYEDADGFELVLDLLEDSCTQLLNEILTQR